MQKNDDTSENEEHPNCKRSGTRTGPFGTSLGLTTAKFRMLVNAPSYVRKYQCVIEDNFREESYSYWDILMQYCDIAYCGINRYKIETYINARSKFRKFYYNKNYSLSKHVNRSNTIASDFERKRELSVSRIEFTTKNMLTPIIKIFNLNKPKTIDKTIDQILRCYCMFVRKANYQNQELNIESEIYYNSLIYEADKLIEEYYQVVDTYPHELLQETLDYIQEKAKKLSKNAMDIFERIFEVCSLCGAGCDSRSDLMMHIETKACSFLPIHRCQCMETFDFHKDWCNHWLKPNMNCAAISWHLWRNMSRPNREGCKVYKCDGCQHFYFYFMKFWNHICYCPFFKVYLLANCQCCEEDEKNRLFNENSFQEIVHDARSDKVGIKILKEWAMMPTISFKVKLIVPDDENLFESVFENTKTKKIKNKIVTDNK